ncbi:metallophosphoesterase [Nakamurella aerolata]|uniref:Metallophosphoesterase n=1 Tax=Nakamurella aerolata TaxID=1656892 RepID=A0A849AHY1_9ACTN|nr:metallophosphoesterase [Nakamurella aerolata]NNG36432.1 metallophosphoesterase [Nakamurella aerolata]
MATRVTHRQQQGPHNSGSRKPGSPGSRHGVQRRRRTRLLPAALAAVTAVAVCQPLVSAAGVGAPAAGFRAATTDACAAMTMPVYERVNPTTAASLFTVWESEARTADTKYGYSDDRGVPFTATRLAAPGLTPVYRMYNPSQVDFMWVAGDAARDEAAAQGYREQGPMSRMYALTAPTSCAQPVRQFVKHANNRTKHRLAVSAAEREQLTADGWTESGVAFYAPTQQQAANESSRFTIAVYPDTQMETGTTDPRFKGRTNWLLNNRSALNLKFVMHTGDVVNWGWVVPSQYQVASDAMRPLEAAGVPYALTLGNHDTRAVGWNGIPGSRGYGGAAYVGNPECKERFPASECVTSKLLRHTEEFNKVFTAERFGAVAGSYEPGKVDNTYSRFSAAGKDFMVLTLEAWPRPQVVDWAKQVVADHPNDNVLVQVHAYLEPNGSIGLGNDNYGAMTPKYLQDNLISKYKNIKAVFSGHVGSAAHRTDTYEQGNKVVSYLNNQTDVTGNPVSLITIDVAAGTMSRRIADPAKGADLDQYATFDSGITFQ